MRLTLRQVCETAKAITDAGGGSYVTVSELATRLGVSYDQVKRKLLQLREIRLLIEEYHPVVDTTEKKHMRFTVD